MKQDCSNCRYSEVGISDEPGEGPILKCRRYPPVVMVLDGEVIQTSPDAHGWCGEYQSVSVDFMKRQDIMDQHPSSFPKE